jgi:competence protein ComEA
MKNNIDFNISKRNKRGIVLLSIFTFCFIYYPRLYFYCQPKMATSIHSFPSKKWEKEHKSYSNFDYSKIDYSKKDRYSRPKQKFDPNKYTIKDWMNLGLSEKQAAVVLKFTKRGIYSNEDLKRVFIISDELFSLIKDSTFYVAKENRYLTNEKENFLTVKINVLTEINQATEEELINLKGVGAFFAKQIVKKRNELGGFISKEQLLEVWKMDEEKYLIIKDQIIIDQSLIHKISLNRVSIDELKIHPYIRWNIANSIIKMREQRKGFQSIDEIKESVLINEELFEKLKPYLSL